MNFHEAAHDTARVAVFLWFLWTHCDAVVLSRGALDDRAVRAAAAERREP